jgi:hypothetical protein
MMRISEAMKECVVNWKLAAEQLSGLESNPSFPLATPRHYGLSSRMPALPKSLGCHTARAVAPHRESAKYPEAMGWTLPPDRLGRSKLHSLALARKKYEVHHPTDFPDLWLTTAARPVGPPGAEPRRGTDPANVLSAKPGLCRGGNSRSQTFAESAKRFKLSGGKDTLSDSNKKEVMIYCTTNLCPDGGSVVQTDVPLCKWLPVCKAYIWLHWLRF